MRASKPETLNPKRCLGFRVLGFSVTVLCMHKPRRVLRYKLLHKASLEFHTPCADVRMYVYAGIRPLPTERKGPADPVECKTPPLHKAHPRAPLTRASTAIDGIARTNADSVRRDLLQMNDALHRLPERYASESVYHSQHTRNEPPSRGKQATRSLARSRAHAEHAQA